MNVLPICPPPPLISFWWIGHVALLSTWPQGVAAHAPALPQWVFPEVSPPFATTNQSSLISTFSELASLSFLPSDVMHLQNDLLNGGCNVVGPRLQLWQGSEAWRL